MYKLYSMPGSCSTGIHILLKILKQDFKVIPKGSVDNYEEINSLGTVPVLDTEKRLIREGAAIALYLLEKHKNDMLPTDLEEKNIFLQKLMFNYATMHPAYNRLFFAAQNFEGKTQEDAFDAATKAINALWKSVDKQLETSLYVSGDRMTIIDFLLCIYANWGTFFDVRIDLGPNVTRMIRKVSRNPDFVSAFKDEGIEFGLFKM